MQPWCAVRLERDPDPYRARGVGAARPWAAARTRYGTSRRGFLKPRRFPRPFPPPPSPRARPDVQPGRAAPMSGRSAAACAEERERENKGARPLPPGRPADPPLALVAAGGHHQPPLQVLQRGVAGSAAAAGHVCRRKARARGHSCRVPLASRVCLLAPSLCLGLWQLPREVLPAGAGWGLGGARCVYGSVRVRHTWPCRLRCGAACGAAGASWAAAASTRRKQHFGRGTMT